MITLEPHPDTSASPRPGTTPSRRTPSRHRPPRSAIPHGGSARAVAPDTRVALLAALRTGLTGAGITFAFQGPSGSATAWTGQDGPDDLDVWIPSGDRESARAVLLALGGDPIACAARPGRLQHDVWGFLLANGPAVVDLTVGDLCVGPVRCCPEDLVSTAPDPERPRLTDIAAAADLVLRPLLRGRTPAPTRLAEGRAAWATADFDARVRWKLALEESVGTPLAAEIIAVLDGVPVDAELPRRLRRVLARRTLRPSAIPGAWSQRAAILPTRRPGPFGLRRRGVVVVLVGTDGSGKSTVAEQVGGDLEAGGFTVRRRYFGMARGNLPGVTLARRLLGVRPDPRSTSTPGTPMAAIATIGTGAEDPNGPVPAAGPADSLDHPRLRRMAAWYYAAEYLLRYAVQVVPARARGEVVLCDRWITDLCFGPWPGSRAAGVVERLVGWPEVLVLPDAPAELIHARKPERSLSEVRSQQAALRHLLGRAPGTTTAIVIDTSGLTRDPERPVVRAVVREAHRRTTATPGSPGASPHAPRGTISNG